MQVTGWDTQQRGRFESYRAIFSCLGFSQMSWIIGRFGNLGALQASILSKVFYEG